MARNRAVYLLFLAFAGIFYLNYSGWIAWFTVLLALLLPPVCLLLTLPSALLRRAGFAGAGFFLRQGDGTLEVRDVSGRELYDPLCLARVTRRDLVSGETVRARRSFTGQSPAVLEVPTAHCGVYLYTLDRCRVTGPLGLISLPIARREKTAAAAVFPEPVAPDPAPRIHAGGTLGLVPKPGGGLAEQYENRAYRPGDPVRAIHWKLTAKTEEVVVREPQIEKKDTVLVELLPADSREELDVALGYLRWLSEALLAAGLPHILRFRALTRTVADEETLRAALYAVMEEPLAAEERRSGTGRADRVYLVSAEGVKEAAL